MSSIKFMPVLSSIQKIRIYETKTTIYLIGSNMKESRFRILQIKRNNNLDIYEDPNEYSDIDIRRLLTNLKFSRTISAFGLLGCVKFLEGYYLLLITKRNKIAAIGLHIIFTIKDVAIYKISQDSVKVPNHNLEQKFLKMFMNVDLSSNFYFSYSYDISRTLQYNMAEPKFVGENVNIDQDEKIEDWNAKLKFGEERIYAYRSTSRKRYVWNDFLLEPLRQKILYKDWTLELIHGFVSQSSISILGRLIYVCLIARRSTKFAGTRFLKRGANLDGDVANEVETEQIVQDGYKLSSFVQIRGSIPSHWSQDIRQIVPKPPISIDIADPFSETAGKHFEKLLFHYGSPIVVLNLVKKREKRKHESLLTKEYVHSIKYLNQFLPSNSRIKYIHFDMARKNKTERNVMESLATIAENAFQSTGMFYMDNIGDIELQSGIIRVNCVDCLDRTNTAQFSLGKCALGHQLKRLGFLKDLRELEFDSDCIKMLEYLYELHGDTLALQYGGSQLVHRIKTYRKTSAWPVDKGNDIIQSMSRYYSNTFSDTEKQHSINLFLGYYQPHKEFQGKVPIWEIPNDYYIHNIIDETRLKRTRPATQWFSNVVHKNLPNSVSNSNKIVRELIQIHNKSLEMIDLYSNYHSTFQLTSLEENVAFQINLMALAFMPTNRTNFSPFIQGNGNVIRNVNNPSLTGQSSTGSTTSSNSSSSEDGENTSTNDEEFEEIRVEVVEPSQRQNIISIDSVIESCSATYGFTIDKLSPDQLLKYTTYAEISKESEAPSSNTDQPTPSTSAAASTQQPLLNVERVLRPFKIQTLGHYPEEVRLKEDSELRKSYEKLCDLDLLLKKSSSNENLDIIVQYLSNINEPKAGPSSENI